MNREICFRVDGGATLGLGHVVRCMSLAYMLREDFRIKFFVRELPENMKNKISEEGFKLIIIEEEKEFLKSLEGSEIVVLDHYGLDSDFQKAVKSNGNFLVCIDDIPGKKFYADLIINHAPGIASADYEAEDYTHFALGLDYALLRPEFLKAATEEYPTKIINHLFICFGGSDYNNYTTKTLKIAMARENFKIISVVLGQAFEPVEQVKSLAEKDNRVQVHIGLSANEMVNLMGSADMAIVPSSGILMEALALRCKPISGMYVDNQAHIYKRYKEDRLFVDAKNFQERYVDEAFDSIQEFEVPEKVIDGRSGQRIAQLLKSLQK